MRLSFLLGFSFYMDTETGWSERKTGYPMCLVLNQVFVSVLEKCVGVRCVIIGTEFIFKSYLICRYSC